ncbi:transglycosylase domain-containing protein [Asanoa sp. NPDC049573]|uniref:transglycosylase domain-containing protein n=1 Tax=Asanoa sp. NPDC049573 TaxID=3155396 RepID=UPI0034341A29
MPAPGAGGGAAGHAPVGRAVVSPVSPGGPNGPGGPGGPTGPRGRGGKGGNGDDPRALAKAKRRKRINWIVIPIAVFVLLAGLGVVTFTWYSTKVPTPESIIPPSATTILAKDNSVIAKLGSANRELVAANKIPDFLQKEVASAEDRGFFSRDGGVDYAGIVRAALNNATGGDKQGASTITQQYARKAYDGQQAYGNLTADSYGRKVKEAVLASKLAKEFDATTIMSRYLNIIYFGRGAWGIQAAARAYFGKDVDKLNVAEGAVLAGVIKQPDPDAVTGHKGFDPAINLKDATDRWNYVLDGMVEQGWLTPADRPTAYPAFKKPDDKACTIDCGINTPQGNVVNYVKEEMADMKLCDLTKNPASGKQSCSEALQNGGYRIKTTIDPKMQAAAVAVAQRAKKGSVINGQPANLQAAVVAIEPKTGRVLAYYGGDNGTGTDYAGKNVDAAGNITGGHPPGSTFKVYTLAAGLNAGVSLDSHWKGKPFTIEGTEIHVQNAGRDPGNNVSLRTATLQSYNVPFYYMTMKIGTDKVIDMAHRAGISTMWATDHQEAVNLASKPASELTPSPFFSGITGYGQYPITVIDHANGVATMADRGIYNKAHFVTSVSQNQQGQWVTVGGEKLDPRQTISQEVADNVGLVLRDYPEVAHHVLADGRPAAEKTGTWELNSKSSDNGDAWMVGYTPQLATAVWVGNKGDAKALLTKDGTKISGSGLPGEIFERFMNKALDGKPKEPFPSGVQKIGDPNAGNGETPPPPPPVIPGQQPTCTDPNDLLCVLQGQNQGQNQGHGQGHN